MFSSTGPRDDGGTLLLQICNTANTAPTQRPYFIASILRMFSCSFFLVKKILYSVFSCSLHTKAFMRPRQPCCIQFFMGEGMATLIAKKTQKCMRGAAGYKLSAVPCDLGYYPWPSLKPIPSPPLFHSHSICVPPMHTHLDGEQSMDKE